MATGIGNLPYVMPPVSPFDTITAQETNERIANIEAVADGTGIGDGAIDTVALAAGAVETAKINDGAVTSAKVDFTTFVQRQNNTTNTNPGNVKIKTGWGIMTTSTGTSVYSEVVTFDTTNAFTDKPIVLISFGGDSVTANTSYGSGNNTIEATVVVKAIAVNNTNFTAYARKPDGSNYGGNGNLFYQWIAIGT